MIKNKLLKTTISLIVIALASLSLGATAAALTRTSNTIVNNFKAADVNTSIVEIVDERPVLSDASIVKEVSIQNDGPTRCFVRARITVSPNIWTDTEDGISMDILDGWMDGGDGFYYYDKIIEVGEKTDELIKKVRVGKNVTENFDVTVYEESVEAIGFPVWYQGEKAEYSLETIKNKFQHVEGTE